MRGPGGMRAGAAALAGALGAVALAPAQAGAHSGLVQRSDLPIPEDYFAIGAAIVLVVSFAALALLWPSPRLERHGWRPLPGGIGRALGSRPVEILCGAIGAATLAVIVWVGFAGPPGPQENLAPTFVMVIVWVGVVFASVLFGDVFRALSPWRAVGRATGWICARAGRPPRHREYPEWLGRWPAAAVLLAFTWVELASGWGAEPRSLTTAVVLYSVITWAGMAVYGVETWNRNGEGFAVYFGLFARLAIFEARDGVVGVRPPLSGLPQLERRPGTVGLVAVMIGTVTFDGFSQGSIWRDASLEITDFLVSVGLSFEQATRAAGTLGLLLGVGLIAGFYALGIAGARTVGGDHGAERLRRGFAHSLVPIAMVYVAAHYLTALLYQGQAVAYLASDPIGKGWDLFGAASAGINYDVISQNGIWYAQVGFVVLGHVAALILAHDRALVLYGRANLAVRSQYWMLGVMVGFTILALWLLKQANA